MVSFATQSVIGHSPTEAFQADVVGEMLTEFQEQAEWYLCLENSDTRVCDLIRGPLFNRVWLTDHPEEAVCDRTPSEMRGPSSRIRIG
jgi:hypothetical protein